jgi:hypothetical protein
MIKALAPLGFAVGTYMWARHDLQPSLFPLLQMVSKMSVCAFVAVITTRELFDRVCTSTEDDTTFLAWTEAPKQFIRDVPWWYPRENKSLFSRKLGNQSLADSRHRDDDFSRIDTKEAFDRRCQREIGAESRETECLVEKV